MATPAPRTKDKKRKSRIKTFRCEKCGKRIVQRNQSGLWHFMYGLRVNEEGIEYCPVEIYIHGSIKIKCLRKECCHWNVLNYFPNVGVQEKLAIPESK